MDLQQLTASMYAVIRETNAVDDEVEEATIASRDHEAHLSVPRAERLQVRIADMLHEIGIISGDPSLDLLRAQSPKLVTQLLALTERLTRAREMVVELTP
jgi:hypothetical protein